MSIPVVLFIIGLVLAIIEEIRARGESLVSWAVIVVCVGLLWGHL